MRIGLMFFGILSLLGWFSVNGANIITCDNEGCDISLDFSMEGLTSENSSSEKGVFVISGSAKNPGQRFRVPSGGHFHLVNLSDTKIYLDQSRIALNGLSDITLKQELVSLTLGHPVPILIPTEVKEFSNLSVAFVDSTFVMFDSSSLVLSVLEDQTDEMRCEGNLVTDRSWRHCARLHKRLPLSGTVQIGENSWADVDDSVLVGRVEKGGNISDMIASKDSLNFISFGREVPILSWDNLEHLPSGFESESEGERFHSAWTLLVRSLASSHRDGSLIDKAAKVLSEYSMISQFGAPIQSPSEDTTIVIVICPNLTMHVFRVGGENNTIEMENAEMELKLPLVFISKRRPLPYIDPVISSPLAPLSSVNPTSVSSPSIASSISSSLLVKDLSDTIRPLSTMPELLNKKPQSSFQDSTVMAIMGVIFISVCVISKMLMKKDKERMD